MSTLANRVKEAMESAQVGNTEVAKYVGCRSQAVTQWRSGQTKNLKGENLYRFAKLTGFHPEYIATGKLPKRPDQIINEPTPSYHITPNPKLDSVIIKLDSLNDAGIEYITEQLELILNNSKYTADPPVSKIAGGSQTG